MFRKWCILGMALGKVFQRGWLAWNQSAEASVGKQGINIHPPCNMDLAVPLPEMGHNWLEKAKIRFMADPEAQLVLEHTGPVQSSSIADFVELAEAHSRQQGDPVALRKRLLRVVIEAADNMSRHAMTILGESSFVLLVQDRAGYQVATGNAVPAATAVLLSHRLGMLNVMELDDLKEHYLKLLSSNTRSSNGGAGLGLMTLARKVVRPIRTSASPLGPFTAYFTFEMRVGPGAGQFDPVAA